MSRRLLLLPLVPLVLAGAVLVPAAAAVSPTLTGTITADKAVYNQGDTVTLRYSVDGAVPHGGQPAIYLACYFNGGYDYAYWNALGYPTDPRFSDSPTLPSGTVTWSAVIRSAYSGSADCYADLFIDTPQHHYYKLAEAEFDVDS